MEDGDAVKIQSICSHVLTDAEDLTKTNMFLYDIDFEDRDLDREANESITILCCYFVTNVTDVMPPISSVLSKHIVSRPMINSLIEY